MRSPVPTPPFPAQRAVDAARADPPVPSLHVLGSAVVYRLYDVGYAIDLDRALAQLAESAPERVRPVRGEAQALQIPNPPVTVLLGAEVLVVAGEERDVELSARLFDFGVVSLRARVRSRTELEWRDFTAFALTLDAHPDLPLLFQDHLLRLVERIAPAIERAAVADLHEEYTVYRVTQLRDAAGNAVPPDILRDEDVVPLLLNETRPLSADARRELLPHRFRYYGDDLAILTWDNALVIEPGAADTDLQYILEFANAQLLELRYYDALLDAELPRLYDRVEETRSRVRWYPGRRFAGLLTDLQRQVADITEVVERAENAIKVTDDVYLARVYTAAIDLFRGRAWRAGIDRKLGILRDTYSMLNGESQASRAEALELAIVILIVLEIVLAFVPH